MHLYRPHVTGPEGAVTTPDVIVDRLIVDGAIVPVRHLTCEAWLQVAQGSTAKAAYCLVALGGGAIVAPAVVLDDGTVSLSRAAWRLNNLDDRIADVTLNGDALSDVGLPVAAIEAAGGEDDTLPRGFAVVVTGGNTPDVARLKDDAGGREIRQKLHTQPPDHDAWNGERPTPRYSVGPTQRDVQHYI